MVTIQDILELMRQNEINFDEETMDAAQPLNDQGLDSLDMSMLYFAIEEKFDIKILERDIERGRLGSIQEIIDFLNH